MVVLRWATNTIVPDLGGGQVLSFSVFCGFIFLTSLVYRVVLMSGTKRFSSLVQESRTQIRASRTRNRSRITERRLPQSCQQENEKMYFRDKRNYRSTSVALQF